MTITTRDGIANALGNAAQTLLVGKTSLANQTAGQPCSMWRSTGTPAQAVTPTATAAVLDHTTTGALTFAQQTAPAVCYLGAAWMRGGNATQSVQIFDRLANVGTLSGTVTTAQTAGVDVTGTGSNMAERRGASNYSEVAWFLEPYADLGATSVTATCAVTFDDGSTANIAVTIPATWRTGRLLPIVVPAANAGRFIRSVNTVTLSATTGTAGNFGVTAGRFLGEVSWSLANVAVPSDWAAIGFPKVPNSACLWLVVIPSTTSSGTVDGFLKLAAG